MDAQQLKALGNEAFAAHQYKKAAKIYRDAIALDAANPILFSNRAACFIKLEDYERASRDCDSGLSLAPDDKTTLKLWYRKGAALVGLGQVIDGAGFFEKVLEKDPSNKAAQDELKKCECLAQEEAMDVDDDHIESNLREIPLQVVETLPAEFQAMLNPKPKPKPQPAPKIQQLPEPTDAAAREIELMFGNKKPKSKPVQETPTFNERSGSMPLTSLKSIEGSKKEKAYEYVITLPPAVIQDTFSLGLDAEFLSFYLEAAAAVSVNKSLPDWEPRVLTGLKTLKQLKRYDMSLMFADPKNIQTLLGNVTEKPQFEAVLT